MVEKVNKSPLSRVARGGLWRGVRVAAGVSGGAAVAIGAVAKRAPAEACWGGRLALPLAFAALKPVSVAQTEVFPMCSEKQLYIGEVKKNDVYNHMFATGPYHVVKNTLCRTLTPIQFAFSRRCGGSTFMLIRFFVETPCSPARLAAVAA